MQPWGDIRKILVFWQILQKKISKIGCILGKIFVWQSCSQLNKLSNSVHIVLVDCNFQAVKVHQSQNFHLFNPFFESQEKLLSAVGSKKISLFFNFFYEDCSVLYKIW